MALSSEKLKSKTVLITGAGKGIGRELCLNLALKQGMKVIALSRTQSDLDELKKLIDCTTICFDLQNVDQIASLYDELSTFKIDYLINNAAIGKLSPFLETSLLDFQQHLTVNVTAVFELSKLVSKIMIENKIENAAIVNVSSQASLVGLIGHTAYNTSKGALDSLTRMMALELAQYKIRTNSVNPTVVLTDMGKMAWGDPLKSISMTSRIPLNKFAEVENVIDAIIFLLSTDMVNGITLPVDGGFLASPFNLSIK